MLPESVMSYESLFSSKKIASTLTRIIPEILLFTVFLFRYFHFIFLLVITDGFRNSVTRIYLN